MMSATQKKYYLSVWVLFILFTTTLTTSVYVLMKALSCVVFFFFFKCREVYHTKRMQHVICVKWSADNKYILSGSDEMNIRLWKANASEKLGVVSPASFSLYHFADIFQPQSVQPACCLLAAHGEQYALVCVPINSCVFLGCQPYCILYLPPVFHLIFFMS